MVIHTLTKRAAIKTKVGDGIQGLATSNGNLYVSIRGKKFHYRVEFDRDDLAWILEFIRKSELRDLMEGSK